MVVIFKSLLHKKSVIQYLLIFMFMIGAFLILMNIKMGFDDKIYLLCNKEEHRSVGVRLKNEDDLEIVQQSSYVERYYDKEDYQVFVLKDYRDIDIFHDEYEKYIASFLENRYSMSPLLGIISTSLGFLMVGLGIILIFIFLVYMIDLYKHKIYDLSLYKILGYKNKFIYLIMLLLFLIIFSIAFLFGILLSVCLSWLLSVFVFSHYAIDIRYFDLSLVSLIYGLGTLLLLLLSLVIYLKIKRITPIQFIKRT